MSEIEITVDERTLSDIAGSDDVVEALNLLGMAVVARGVLHIGNDTGNLRGSFRHEVVEQLDGDATLYVGADPEYTIHHFAPGRPDGPRANWDGTRPITKALDELGIDYDLTGGYPV